MWYDLAVAAILLFCTFRGAAKGFVWQLAAIASVILCFAFAETFSVALAPYLNVNPPLNRWVSMLLLYMLCSFACFAVARGLKNGLEKAKFEDYDRHLGGLFGLLKGAGIAVIVTFFAVTLSERLRPTVLTSHSGYAAAVVMNSLAPVFPAELDKVIEPYLANYAGLEDQAGRRLAGGTSDPGDDLFGDGWNEDPAGGGWDEGPAFADDRRPPAGGGGFGWDEEPDARPVARGSSAGGRAPNLRARPAARPAPRPADGSFGDSGFGDGGFGDGGFGDGGFGDGFGDDPGFAGTSGDRRDQAGQGGDWFDERGGFNTGRLADEAGRFGRGLLDDVPEETREEFGRSLRDGAARRLNEEVDRRVGDLFGDAPGAAAGGDAGPTRDELLDRIAARYTDDPAARDLFRRKAEGMLRGVPEGVVGEVLRDWYADLRGPAAGPDPNPDTTKQTLLPDRIRRGLSARIAAPGDARRSR